MVELQFPMVDIQILMVGHPTFEACDPTFFPPTVPGPLRSGRGTEGDRLSVGPDDHPRLRSGPDAHIICQSDWSAKHLKLG